LADVKEASAIAVGAANTLWLQGGVLHAANTDTYGFMTNLAAGAPGWNERQAPVSVLGAGGAARAIVYGFLEARCPEVRVFNRSLERAQALAAHFGPRVVACPWEQRTSGSRDAAVLVNTTSAGMKGDGGLDIDVGLLSRDCVVADIVYVPLRTELLDAAEAAGLRTVGGLGMLLHQAVPGFERWFGQRPTVTAELYELIAADIEDR
jgi:shikimate dehydrogenase